MISVFHQLLAVKKCRWASTLAPTRKKMTSLEIINRKKVGKKICIVTAYNYPQAVHAERSAVDAILVGDSVAMVELGHPTTQLITMEEMLHHCKAVSRGARSPLLIGDMPFGSYEVSDEEAARNAFRFIKESGMDAVKLEGGARRATAVSKIVKSGISVIGHIGLTPQSISVLGGFRAQGRTAAKAKALLEDALALEDAGAFAIVLECMPSQVARLITDSVEIPTIGIGAGPGTDGQILVYHDLLGMLSHPHHEAFVPKFCKTYASVGDIVSSALDKYRADVQDGIFPSEEFSPYKISEKEQEKLTNLLQEGKELLLQRKKKKAEQVQENDEYATEKLY